MSPQPSARTKRTQDAIAQAARTILQSGPAKNLSMVSLATNSGIARATVYNHISEKADIYRLISESYVDEISKLVAKKNSYNLQNATKELPVEILSGSFLFTKYKFFYNIGFFDEGTFLFCEERILYEKTLRANKKNYLIRSHIINQKWLTISNDMIFLYSTCDSGIVIFCA